MTKVKLVAALVVASELALFAGNEANPDAIELKPLPIPVEFASDMDHPVAFDPETAVTLDCPDGAALAWLQDHFKAWYGKLSPQVAAGGCGLELRPGDEAYAVKADASGVKIAARTLAGVRWAAYSLRQLVIARRGTLRTEGRIVPTLTISDAPHLAFRCLHICWLPEMRAEHIERMIRLAALTKFNYVILEPWGMYRSEKHPWWNWREAKLTKQEVGRLVAIGRDLGVTLIPQIAVYGHAAGARACTLKHSVLDLKPEYEPLYEPGGWNWCLTNPETQRVLRELIVELLDVFGHPPYIHLGCDEAQPPSCPDCRKRPYADLVCEHIANLAKFTKEHGARAMIWHDMMLEMGDPRWKDFIKSGSKLTARLVDMLPKDVIVCDWEYFFDKAEDVPKDWPTLRYFHEKGFPVAACPWMNYPAMRPMADFVRKVGGFGFIETTWNHPRGGDLVKMIRHGSSAAWGSEVPAGEMFDGFTPQYDTQFGLVLRMAVHDMKDAGYRDCGQVDWQLPPSWWIDN